MERGEVIWDKNEAACRSAAQVCDGTFNVSWVVYLSNYWPYLEFRGGINERT